MLHVKPLNYYVFQFSFQFKWLKCLTCRSPREVSELLIFRWRGRQTVSPKTSEQLQYSSFYNILLYCAKIIFPFWIVDIVGCRVSRSVVIDVTLVIDHLTQRCVHKALFVKQISNHSQGFWTQTSFFFQILLLNNQSHAVIVAQKEGLKRVKTNFNKSFPVVRFSKSGIIYLWTLTEAMESFLLNQV